MATLKLFSLSLSFFLLLLIPLAARWLTRSFGVVLVWRGRSAAVAEVVVSVAAGVTPRLKTAVPSLSTHTHTRVCWSFVASRPQNPHKRVVEVLFFSLYFSSFFCFERNTNSERRRVYDDDHLGAYFKTLGTNVGATFEVSWNQCPLLYMYIYILLYLFP